MRITESKLRRIIRSVIKENVDSNEFDLGKCCDELSLHNFNFYSTKVLDKRLYKGKGYNVDIGGYVYLVRDFESEYHHDFALVHYWVDTGKPEDFEADGSYDVLETGPEAYVLEEFNKHDII